ncbi:MAG: cupin domain-containing protein [Desulfobacteraceae bacterium]|nr:MAG: cupin domain-containing protein [Desulfobacteraceae bacterium]
MQVLNWKECEDKKIEKFPYKGQMMEVKGTSVRWLSKYGDDGHGYPEYGLRLFTIQPGGEIPIHNHFYHQTMYILNGEFECWSFDPGTDEIKERKVCTAGTSIFIPSMEPHGMKNLGNEPGRFLCCICNVYEETEEVPKK